MTTRMKTWMSAISNNDVASDSSNYADDEVDYLSYNMPPWVPTPMR